MMQYHTVSSIDNKLLSVFKHRMQKNKYIYIKINFTNWTFAVQSLGRGANNITNERAIGLFSKTLSSMKYYIPKSIGYTQYKNKLRVHNNAFHITVFAIRSKRSTKWLLQILSRGRLRKIWLDVFKARNRPGWPTIPFLRTDSLESFA